MKEVLQKKGGQLNKELEGVCSALDALATAVINSWGADTTVCENFGWFGPAVTRHDLAGLASRLASDIRSTQSETIESDSVKLVLDLPRRLQILQTTTVPHMFGGNGGQAIPAYVSTLALIRSVLLPAIGWQLLPDPKSLPSNLARRARAAQAELDQLVPNLEDLSKQIEDIQAAHKVADNLPIDLQQLSEARERLTRSSLDAASTENKIKDAWTDSEKYLKATKDSHEEAKKLIALCEAAYQITTTKGLAGAFDQRAGALAWSMWTWVGGLVLALGVGSYIGAHRLEVLSTALQAATLNWGGVAVQAVLSLLSVGAPLWFAWLATKQVGQRFRLAEDYAFKATVAKAYEGYRKEAARIDVAFEQRLFGSALSRLDEAPLRLVETHTHGSPWHEFANSEAVRRAFDAAPELRSKVIELLREASSAASRSLGKGEPIPKAAEVKAP
jgi:hypothetical protein